MRCGSVCVQSRHQGHAGSCIACAPHSIKPPLPLTLPATGHRHRGGNSCNSPRRLPRTERQRVSAALCCLSATIAQKKTQPTGKLGGVEGARRKPVVHDQVGGRRHRHRIRQPVVDKGVHSGERGAAPGAAGPAGEEGLSRQAGHTVTTGQLLFPDSTRQARACRPRAVAAPAPAPGQARTCRPRRLPRRRCRGPSPSSCCWDPTRETGGGAHTAPRSLSSPVAPARSSPGRGTAEGRAVCRGGACHRLLQRPRTAQEERAQDKKTQLNSPELGRPCGGAEPQRWALGKGGCVGAAVKWWSWSYNWRAPLRPLGSLRSAVLFRGWLCWSKGACSSRSRL